MSEEEYFEEWINQTDVSKEYLTPSSPPYELLEWGYRVDVSGIDELVFRSRDLPSWWIGLFFKRIEELEE